MAKTKAPLLSLGASGNIGSAVQYARRKTQNVAQAYSTPSVPPSTAQVAHRSAFQVAADDWSTYQIQLNPLTAWQRWADSFSTSRTAYAQFLKMYFSVINAGNQYISFRSPVLTNITSDGWKMVTFAAPEPTTVLLRWGTSIRDMTNAEAMDHPNPTFWRLIKAGLQSDTDYYAQMEVTAPAQYVGNKSGIFFAHTLP